MHPTLRGLLWWSRGISGSAPSLHNTRELSSVTCSQGWVTWCTVWTLKQMQQACTATSQRRLQLPTLDHDIPQARACKHCTDLQICPPPPLRRRTRLRRVPNPLTVFSMCWPPADKADATTCGSTAGVCCTASGSNPQRLLAQINAFTFATSLFDGRLDFKNVSTKDG